MTNDNSKTYVVGFKGRQVDLFDYNGKIIRRFIAKAEVANAQVNGSGSNATVAITMKNGKFEIYKSNGQKIREN